jgi:hypothetical protein
MSAALQLAAIEADAVLTPQQKRFNTLVRQIEQARANLAVWQEKIPAFAQAYAKEVRPLHDALVQARRALALALDGVADRPGWSKSDQVLLSELVCRMAGDLLEETPDDAALLAVFARHNAVDFETARRQRLQGLIDMMQADGAGLGDTGDIRSEEDLSDRLHERMREELAAEQARRAAQAEHQRQRKGKSAAQRKREAEEAGAALSLREIFRKLASALHPDRETDAAKRAAKTALMQRANLAYTAGDLLALLQLQLEIEQVDALHIANAGAEKLAHYNKVLAEQLQQIKGEVERLQMGFRADMGLPVHAIIHAHKLGDMIKQTKAALREDLDLLQEETRMLANQAWARRWLRRFR